MFTIYDNTSAITCIKKEDHYSVQGANLSIGLFFLTPNVKKHTHHHCAKSKLSHFINLSTHTNPPND